MSKPKLGGRKEERREMLVALDPELNLVVKGQLSS